MADAGQDACEAVLTSVAVRQGSFIWRFGPLVKQRILPQHS